MVLTLLDLLTPSDVNRPALTNTKAHLKAKDITLTYHQLQTQLSSLSSQLYIYTQLSSNDRVTLLCDNSIEFVLTFLSIVQLRGVACPLNATFTSTEFEFYLKDSNSKTVILHENLFISNDIPILKVIKKLNLNLLILKWNNGKVELTPWNGNNENNGNKIYEDKSKNIKPIPSDVALLLHTSGTTGQPKAVPLTHKNIVTTLKNIINTYHLTSNDKSYIVMPLFHVHGLIGALFSTLLSGGHCIIPPKFSATTFWEDFGSYECTWYSAVPTIHQILLNIPFPKQEKKINIRFIRSCSSSLAPKTFEDLKNKFQAPVLEAYAMTEAAHQMTSNPLSPNQQKPGSVGIPQGVSIKILDSEGKEVEEGEVCIKGENVTKGYLNNIKANQESFTLEGYFRTGDQGKFDKDGYLFLTGRIKELINRGGEKISPLEVDGVLLQHGKIAEAVCFAVDDKKYGQEVNAVIKVKEGQKVTEQEIKNFCELKMAKFKVPKKIYFTDKLPKTATGKIQRRKMVEFFGKKAKI